MVLSFTDILVFRFVTVKLPEGARHNGTVVSLIQYKHSGSNQDDWLIDNFRVGGRRVNPTTMVSDFSSDIDPAEWNTFDHTEAGRYCDTRDVALGEVVDEESATLTTQDLDISEGHMMQFWYNIGCLRAWNMSVAPLHLQYSTDYGMTWSYINSQCLSNDANCPAGATMATVYYGDPTGRWLRVTRPLTGLTISR